MSNNKKDPLTASNKTSYVPFVVYTGDGSKFVANLDQPSEPSVFSRMEELLKRLDAVEALRGQLHADLFGYPPPVAMVGAVSGESKALSGFEEMLATACTKAASLVGGMRTINQRMGCKEI